MITFLALIEPYNEVSFSADILCIVTRTLMAKLIGCPVRKVPSMMGYQWTPYELLRKPRIMSPSTGRALRAISHEITHRRGEEHTSNRSKSHGENTDT